MKIITVYDTYFETRFVKPFCKIQPGKTAPDYHNM